MHLFIINLITTLLVISLNGKEVGGVQPEKYASESSGIQMNWIKQRLDHNKNDNATDWNQRYFASEKYWKNDTESPVFLMISGESEVPIAWMSGGAWSIWAERYGAMMFLLEHRFYGQSHPTTDASVENLKYLSSEQALGDIAYFIELMNSQYNFTSGTKWILFGGRYAGNLAAWTKLKYPDHVYGSVASSAPLQAKANFYEYFDVGIKALDSASPGCASAVNSATRSIQTLLKTDDGAQTVIKKFNVCNGFEPKNPFYVAALTDSLSSSIGSAILYNGQVPIGTDFVCRYMNNQTVRDPVDRLAQLYNATNTGCADGDFSKITPDYQQTSWDSDAVSSGSRQWYFQTCNEFGYYQTSISKSSLFSDTMPLVYFTKLCTDIFGSNFNPEQLNNAIDRTNQYYHGTDIRVKNVIFVQGSMDPWHPLGMVKRPTPEDPLIYIQGGSHSQDMQTPQNTDSPSLKNARRMIQRILDQWLA